PRLVSRRRSARSCRRRHLSPSASLLWAWAPPAVRGSGRCGWPGPPGGWRWRSPRCIPVTCSGFRGRGAPGFRWRWPRLRRGGWRRCGAGVDHGPGGDPVGEAGGLVGPFDEVVGATPFDAVAAPVDEQWRFRAELDVGEPSPAGVQVPVDERFEWCFDGDGALFAAFADDGDAPFAGAAVDGAEVEADEFREAQPGEQGGGDEGQ